MTDGRVVIADPDRRVAGVLSWLLAEQGFETTIAHPPRALDQTLRWDIPDLLLVDADNPELAGLIKRYRREPRSAAMRIIAATANPSALPDGADDLVGKPYRAAEVLTRVQAQLKAASELAAARREVERALGEADRARDTSVANRRLADVLRDVADELSAPEIYRVLARRVGHSLGVRHCAVILADPDPDSPTAVVAAALEEPGMMETTIQLASYPEIARALVTNRTVLVEDAATDPLYAAVRRAARDSARPFDLQSVIALPFAMGEVQGALFIRTEPGERALTRNDADFADLVMHAAVSAIRRGQALETTRADNRRLEELATTDSLTGLLNRRALAERLAVEMDRATRYSANLSILLVDIDYFKRVNDSAGHLAGDEVLRQVANLIEEAVRTVDIVARYGGEEFVVILPETGGEGALVFAERLRERVATREFSVGGRPIRLTVSVGIATFPTADVSSADDLFSRADAAMYRAKASGRNLVRT